MSNRVLVVSEHFRPKISGTVTYVESLCKALGHIGIQPVLIAPEAGSQSTLNGKQNFEGDVVFVNPLEFSTPRDLLRTLTFHQQRIGARVIHVMHGHYVFRSLPRGGPRLVWTCHNVPPEEYPPWMPETVPAHEAMNSIYRRAVRLKHKVLIRTSGYDRIIAVSNAVRRTLVAAIGVRNEQIIVIPHGIEIHDELRSPESLISSLPKTMLNLLTVGAIKTHKNIHLIPALLARLANSGLDVVWHVVGAEDQPSYAKKAKNLAVQLGVRDRIVWHGQLPQKILETLWQQCELCVHLSSAEGFSLAVLEALAHGMPVLGTNVGAIPDMLSKGGGIVVEPNEESIWRGLRWITQNWDFFPSRRRLSELTRTTYSWQACARATAQVYDELMVS